MIYSWCTFLECYSVFSPPIFLPTHRNGEVRILGNSGLLKAYSQKWGSHDFRKTTLCAGKLE